MTIASQWYLITRLPEAPQYFDQMSPQHLCNCARKLLGAEAQDLKGFRKSWVMASGGFTSDEDRDNNNHAASPKAADYSTNDSLRHRLSHTADDVRIILNERYLKRYF
jgi:hypothetical protein